MLEITCEQAPVDISELSPEDRQLFARLVHFLLEDNKWMLLEEAQRYAYQQVYFKRIEDLD